MRIDIVTLFPEMCENLLSESIIGRARARGYLQVCCHQLRDFGEGVHRRVDDCTFGGGKGMLLMAEPIAACFDALRAHTGHKGHMLYMSPRGRVLTQERVKALAKEERLTVLCGHYEGVDERVLEAYGVEEVSIGDFVLTGGELPAVLLTDAVSRMLPGVLSEDACFTEESHFDGLLEYPQYTRPASWRGREVPAALLSGHHGKIQQWRRAESLSRTREARPDLFEKLTLTKADFKLLQEKDG